MEQINTDEPLHDFNKQKFECDDDFRALNLKQQQSLEPITEKAIEASCLEIEIQTM